MSDCPDCDNWREEANRLHAEVERLKDILRADGLDSDMPIPPGLNLRMERAEADLARVRADHKMLLDSFNYHGYMGEMGKTYQVTLSEEVLSRYRAALEGRG